MNFLSLFVLIPLLMTCAMFLTKDIRRIRAIMVVGRLAVAGPVRGAGGDVSGRTQRGERRRNAVHGRCGVVRSAEYPLFGRRRRYFSGDVAAVVGDRLYRGVRFVENVAATAGSFSHGSRCCRSGCSDSSFRLICSRCSCFTRWR